MKRCLVCGAVALESTHACASCGSADWQPIPIPSPPPPPATAPSTPSRDKRTKV